MKEFILEEELKKVPDAPGVYIMHDAKDVIIYIGKAKSLTKRVHQYFRPSHDEGLKKAQMVERISYFEYIVTDSELEALVLENNLIKEHRPKYNTMLRDDKTYPYIKVTIQEDYPRILFARSFSRDKNKYFGPFTSAGAVKDTISLTQKLFKIRSCNQKFPENFGKNRPCLNYHMKQCQGICTGDISKEEYAKNVEGALDFLSGNIKPVVADIQSKMESAAEAMEFERAAEYRDLLQSIKSCMETQKITDSKGEDRDIIALALDGEDGVVQVFFVRGGHLIGREHFFINVRLEDTPSEVLSAFILQYYSGTPFVPKELYLPEVLEDANAIEDWLSAKRNNRVHLVTPQRGQKSKLVDMAAKNAKMVLDQDRERIKKEEGRTIGAMKELMDCLGMEGLNRIEAYDISNISGFNSVGSMVVFEKGKPLPSDYRKFRLKTVDGPNDYASQREVLMRRFTHGLVEANLMTKEEADAHVLGTLTGQVKGTSANENANDNSNKTDATKNIENSFVKFPDIILMDGGRGQVNICEEVLNELGLNIPVCGMVKDDHHRTRGLYFNNKEIPIDKSSAAFMLVTRVQDEAHRFAIEYHRSLRTKEQVHSFLDDIPGIGPKRRLELMRRFAGIDEMREADMETLMSVKGMNEASAKAVWDYFHSS